MADAVGWRSFWWLNAGLFVFCLIMAVFTFPETKWHRVHPSELNCTASTGDIKQQISVKENASSMDTSPLEHQKTPINSPVTDTAFPNLEASETAARDPHLGKGSPSKQQFKLWQPAYLRASLITEFWTPWKLLAFPIIEFASFVVSWSAGCFLMLNLTQTQNFAAPPYMYSSLVIGKYNVFKIVKRPTRLTGPKGSLISPCSSAHLLASSLPARYRIGHP
jgi:hypothetical protein